MQILCHRCGEAASTRDQAGDVTSFCPHCGAPQLIFEADEPPTPEDPALPARQTRPRLVEWRAALAVAAIIGAGAALLCIAAMRLPIFSLLTWVWITSASLIALGLYRRRRPQARIDAAIGARIGLAVGLALATGLAFAMAAAGVLARFQFHTMGNFDAMVLLAREQYMQRAVASGMDAATLAAMRSVYDSPEIVAGSMVFGLLILFAGLVVYSTIAGALGGMMHTRRNAIS